MPTFAKKRLTPAEIDDLLIVRHRARHDLYFFMTEILGYPDIDMEVQGPYIRTLDKVLEDVEGKDIITPQGEFLYIPREESFGAAVAAERLRNIMILGFRGSIKTTTNVQAHSAQIILNFPHIAGAIIHNTEEVAASILKETAEMFWLNAKMKAIFPEYCIHNMEDVPKYFKKYSFTTPARYLGNTNITPFKKEPTLTAMGLGTSQAGRHFQFLKLTDVVEEVNSQTENTRNKVAKSVTMARNLLEDGSCFMFVEGTPYHVEDAYCRIIQREWHQRAPSEREWEIVWHPAYHVETKGRPRTYTPDEMSLPFARASRDIVWAKGVITRRSERIPVWPTWRSGTRKFDNVELNMKEREDEYVFACQQLLRPASSSTAIFPIEKCFKRFPEDELEKLNTVLRIMSVDTASSTDPTYSNDTAITCGIVSDSLFRVVTDGVIGLLEDFEIIEALFDYYISFRPDVLVIESTQFTQGLKGQIHEQEIRRKIELPLEWVIRPRSVNKKNRIQGALRSPLSLGRLKFSTGLSPDYIERMKLELSGFPTSKHDDGLDSLEMFVTASKDMASYDSERSRVRALLEEEREQMRLENEAYYRKLMCQEFPDQEEAEEPGLVTSLGF